MAKSNTGSNQIGLELMDLSKTSILILILCCSSRGNFSEDNFICFYFKNQCIFSQEKDDLFKILFSSCFSISEMTVLFPYCHCM